MKHPIPEKKIQAVANKIARNFKPEKIILFGSYAWGKPGPDSDVDLFIIAKTKNTRELAREIGGSIFPRPFPLDLVVFRPWYIKGKMSSGDFFIKDVLTKGKVLYER